MLNKATKWMLILMLVLALLAPGRGGAAGEASAIRFYVAPSGSDENPGTLERPFATPGRAQRAVREHLAKGLAGDVRVELRAGDYYLPQGLSFDAADGGGETSRTVTWAGYPGEHPRLVGGVRVEGWRRWTGAKGRKIWVAELPQGAEGRQLFDHGRRMTLARTPNQGYFRVAEPVGAPEEKRPGGKAFKYNRRDLGLDTGDPAAWETAGAVVSMWPTFDWFNFEAPLARLEATSRTITLGSPAAGWAITARDRYYIRNLLAALDRPGECRIDLKRRKLYAWPWDGRLKGHEFVLATARPALISVKGEADHPVRGLAFEGLELLASEGQGVQFTNVERCAVRACRVAGAWENGVRVELAARRVELRGNELCEHGLDGVSFYGGGYDKTIDSHHNAIVSNHIHHCGRLTHHGAGIMMIQSGDNEIAHNLIHDMPRYGISMKGVVLSYLKKSVPEATDATRYQYLHTTRNRIAFNHIHHVNLDSQDTGAIESWGPGRDNVIENNLIHDIGNDEHNFQNGIYLDDAASLFTVRSNIIYGIRSGGESAGVFCKGVDNVIENNVFVLGPAPASGVSSFEMADEPNRRHIYRRNIFYFDTKHSSRERAAIAYRFMNWTEDRVAEAGRNLFYSNSHGPVEVYRDTMWLSLAGWQGLGGVARDKGSVVDVDPLFMNITQHDYRLRPDSPALKLGFMPIEMGKCGLLADYPAWLAQP